MEIDPKLCELVEVFLEEHWRQRNKTSDVTVYQFIEACVMDTIVTRNTMFDLPKTQEALDKFLEKEKET